MAVGLQSSESIRGRVEQSMSLIRTQLVGLKALIGEADFERLVVLL